MKTSRENCYLSRFLILNQNLFLRLLHAPLAFHLNDLVLLPSSHKISCEMKEVTLNHLNEMLEEHAATGEIGFDLRLKI